MSSLDTRPSEQCPVTINDSETARLCSVLVPSCDAYSDLWQPFFAQFWKHWPDCPFPVYLGSNQQSFSHSRVSVLQTGPESDWTNHVRTQILALDTPYVLLMLEDFFLREAVYTPDVTACLHALHELDAEMVRLIPFPGPDRPAPPFPFLGTILPGAPYRVCMQAAIWRRDTLIRLMRDGESIWQLELDGTRRSESLPTGFFGVWKPALTYKHHVVERGKWFRHEAAHFGKMDIGCDFSRRGVMTRTEMLRWYIGKVRGALLRPLPRGLRAGLVRLVRGNRS